MKYFISDDRLQKTLRLSILEKKILFTLWFIISIVFFSSMFYCTNYSFTPPIDDSYIYLQYAENLSKGYFFRYNIEDGFSSGTTSFLYPFLIVPAFWIGLSGEILVVYAFILNSLLLLYSSVIFYKLLLSVSNCKISAFFGTIWFLICGPLLWGFFTGMETGLFSMLIIQVLYHIHKLTSSDKLIRNDLYLYAFTASLLAVCRPEGIAFTFFSTILLIFTFRKKSEPPLFSLNNLILCIPVFATILFFLTIFYFGGTFSINTQIAKSYFYSEDMTKPWILMDNALKGIMTFYDIIKGLFFLSNGKWWSTFFPPLTGILFIVGLLYGIYIEFLNRKPGVFLISGTWFILCMIISTFTATKMLYFNRYQIPLFSIFILCVFYLISRLSTLVKKPSLFIKVCGISLLLLSVPSTIFFTIFYGYNCKDIRFLQVEMSRYIQKNLPKDSKIAINDAGALRYIGQRYTYDIIGLTSNSLALARRNGGVASILEYFENIPEDKRPDYFAIYPEWFDIEKAGLVEKVVKKQYLRTNYSVNSKGKILYKMNWSKAGSGSRPSGKLFEKLGYKEKNVQIEDTVDIADVYSEKKHSFKYRMREMGDYSRNIAETLPLFGKKIFDGGRSFNNFQEFNMKTVPGKDYWFIARMTGHGINELVITIDNKPAGKIKITLFQDKFKDIAIPISKDCIHNFNSEFTVLYSSDNDSYKELTSFHYWLVKTN